MEELSRQVENLRKELADLKRRLKQPQEEQGAQAGQESPTLGVAPTAPSIEKMLMDEVRGIVGERLIEIGAKTFEMSKLVEVIEPEEAEKLTKVLASADRIRILKFLFLEGKYFSQLQEFTGLGPSPLNFQLNQLKEAGLVDQEQSRGRYVSTLKGRITLSLLGYLVRKVSGKEW